jgi:hypothetical protein
VEEETIGTGGFDSSIDEDKALQKMAEEEDLGRNQYNAVAVNDAIVGWCEEDVKKQGREKLVKVGVGIELKLMLVCKRDWESCGLFSC